MFYFQAWVSVPIFSHSSNCLNNTHTHPPCVLAFGDFFKLSQKNVAQKKRTQTWPRNIHRDLLHESVQCFEKPSVSLFSPKIFRKEHSSISTDLCFTHASFHRKKPFRSLVKVKDWKRVLLVHYLLISNTEEDSFDCCQRGSHIVHVYIWVMIS